MAYYRRLPRNLRRTHEAEAARRHEMPRRIVIPDRPGSGDELGARNEQRFFEICIRFQQAGHFPHWLLEIALSKPEDEPLGIDFIAKTIGAPIPIQVKSSEIGKDRFHEIPEMRHIPCIVVNDERADEKIFRTLLDEITHVWEMIELARAAR